MAAHLSLSPRTVTGLARKWVEDGFLEIDDPSLKSRSYRLSLTYERLIN
ncbi:hypothetical protein [Nonomuraea sp. B5E05]